MENAINISYYFVNKARKAKESGFKGEKTKITHLKLHKLLYFAQGLYLRSHEESLFEDVIQAWDYGPVIPSVWKFMKNKGADGQNLVDLIPHDELEEGSRQVGEIYKEFLDEFFEVYSAYSADKLVDVTHNHKIWQESHRSEDNRITQKSIQEYFKSLV